MTTDPTQSTNENTEQTELFYEDRFWEQYVGKNLVTDPVIAIVELVANCWDAGAKKVEISWPETSDLPLKIGDDGEGMTKTEFYRRWGGMSYDRILHQGDTVQVSFGDAVRSRHVFGKNGIGRFAGFCFSSRYSVATAKNGERNTFIVRKGSTRPLEFDYISSEPTQSTGTTIEVQKVTGSIIPAETIRTELGRRFLTDPSFQVLVNGVRIAFEDIENKGLEEIHIQVPGLDVEVAIKIIDARRPDPTGRQHGVAWHVLGRLVGDCGWKDPEQNSLIDGRRVEAKRFTFIVEADLLHEAGAVKPDWSGFEEENATFKVVNSAVQSAITARLLEVTKDKRDETTTNVRRSFAPEARQMSPLRRERWNEFINQVAEACPSLKEQELTTVAGVLAKMEVAGSRYGLLHKLHALSSDEIDKLHDVLTEWTVDTAKLVLDEIQVRLKLIDELTLKVTDTKTLEVQELQPLFHRGLWIFGPEFETVELTANEGMTTVIQRLFGATNQTGSRRRPDFAILPSSSVGLLSRPSFDRNFESETGVAHLVVVELKRPGVVIADKEISQCWEYIAELYRAGLLQEGSRVEGFVLGSEIDPIEVEGREYKGRAIIYPRSFSGILTQAKRRLLCLYDKVRSAPFLQEVGINEFLEEPQSACDELPIEAELAQAK